jgi:hypothetical protein
MIGFAGLAFSDFQGPFTTSIQNAILFGQLGFLCVNIAIFFGLLTLHLIIRTAIPKYDVFIGFFQFFLVLWGFIYPIGLVNIIFYIFLTLIIIEIFRVGFRFAVKDNRIMGLGLGIMIIAFVYQILINYDILPLVFGNRVIYVYGGQRICNYAFKYSNP